MQQYNPQKIEKKWQKIWEEEKSFHSEIDQDREKYYVMVEFPYPSGQGLHVGHVRPYTAMDIVARKKRLEGKNVLFPIGWDAFGLPTENYSIKNHMKPAQVTKDNVKNFTRQMKSIGFSFDWDREINTTDPDYYKWTQWIFLQLYKNGLAYKREMPINWCPSCKTGLANEEVISGHCERCGTEVVHKVKSQWMLKITEYADELIDDLESVDYPEKVKAQQKNWIGRSYGMEVDFQVKDVDHKLTVFTTRPDTLYGATYMVLAVEHPLLEEQKERIKNWEQVVNYREETIKKSEFERSELIKEKTGVRLEGLSAINPVNGKEIPIYISDYVLMTYGTGAIMAVPAHDERDHDFAKKFGLPIIEVVSGGEDVQKEAYTDTEKGQMVNSGSLNGLTVDQAKEKISEELDEKGLGRKKVNYKLRDWVFSRQRYWGEPIPMIHCPNCGWVPVPEEDLPVLLPDVDDYEPTDDGESPLSKIDSFVNTTCPRCGSPAKRETDTMPNWAGSSWYYLRYTDPKNEGALASDEAMNYYTPVDWYNGGMEHTTLHLLYSRFWHKFLYDLEVVPTKEPYKKRTSHGMILGSNGEKMSKSRGNVVNPDDIVGEYGADTLRTYEMFIGDFEKSAPWSDTALKGCRKFLDRVWNLQDILVEGEEFSEDLEILFNQTIEKVSSDYENLKYNTAIAQLMTLLNEIRDKGEINKKELKTFIILLNPTAPHITEEIWERQGFSGYLHETSWPEYDPERLREDKIDIPLQVNGKVRSTLRISASAEDEEVKRAAKEDEHIKKYIEGKNIVKEIYVKGKIYNVVVK